MGLCFCFWGEGGKKRVFFFVVLEVVKFWNYKRYSIELCSVKIGEWDVNIRNGKENGGLIFDLRDRIGWVMFILRDLRRL